MAEPKNYAFLDSQNLHLSITELGWRLDFEKLRRYLLDKYSIDKAFLFIGYVEGKAPLYKFLQEAGFICIFKQTLTYRDGTTKGNCDAELVLQAMIEFDHYAKAFIVSGDGDFYCLVQYLLKQGKLGAVLIPNQSKFSALYKHKEIRPYLRFVSDLKNKLEHKKRPHKDETL